MKGETINEYVARHQAEQARYMTAALADYKYYLAGNKNNPRFDAALGAGFALADWREMASVHKYYYWEVK